MPALYSIALVILFYALVVAEFLVPSGGILGLSAGIAAFTGIVIGFTHSFVFGLSVLLVLLLTTPALFAALVRVWPQTAIGRKMLNRRSEAGPQSAPTPTTADGTSLDELAGKFGEATSDLLPSGQVMVDGKKSSAVSIGLPIDSGTPIKVVRVSARTLHVRAATAEEVQQVNQTEQSGVDQDVIGTKESVSESRDRSGDSANAASSATSSLEDVDLEDLDV